MANELISNTKELIDVNGMSKISTPGPSAVVVMYSMNAAKNAPKNRNSDPRNTHIPSLRLSTPRVVGTSAAVTVSPPHVRLVRLPRVSRGPGRRRGRCRARRSHELSILRIVIIAFGERLMDPREVARDQPRNTDHERDRAGIQQPERKRE